MNVGLLYTPVSIYQMTRGALVLFVGALSVIFLRRRLWLYQLSFAMLPTHSAACSITPRTLRLMRDVLLTLVPKMVRPYHRYGRRVTCRFERFHGQGCREGTRSKYV